MKSERILQIPNRISILHHVRRAVSYFIRNHTDPLWENRIILAIDEALSNVIQHGYTNYTKDIIKLTLSCNTKGFVFKIEDNADTFLGQDEKIESRGFGLFIINNIMEMERLQVAKGNILILKKNFSEMDGNIP